MSQQLAQRLGVQANTCGC